uniref:Uncharacterized protein n=1 Tax=Triticum aestivum TaxID=4565 RepID=A0A077RR40_WHEAT|nr:unnamed protein product [Triticum aestivum]
MAGEARGTPPARRASCAAPTSSASTRPPVRWRPRRRCSPCGSTSRAPLRRARPCAGGRGGAAARVALLRELRFDAPARALAAEEALQPGWLYFALPMSMRRRPLSGQEMAALAVKASSALAVASGTDTEFAFEYAGGTGTEFAFEYAGGTGTVFAGILGPEKHSESNGGYNTELCLPAMKTRLCLQGLRAIAPDPSVARLRPPPPPPFIEQPRRRQSLEQRR